jgi:two-component sensor histidine kinase
LKKGTDIHVAVKDKNSDIIFIGTNMGLFRVRYNNENGFKMIDSGQYRGLQVRDILLRNGKNEIWLATYSGVFVLNLKNLKKIHEYVQPNQVSNLKVVKLVEDKSKCIWASTYSGITIYNTKDGTIRFINESHLLNNIEYNNKSACLLSDGKIAFGGLNAFEIIDPKALNEYKYAETFTISGIETIQNENRNSFSAYHEGQKISFRTGKEAIKIYLANLDYQYGNGYNFQYSLDAKNWFNVDKNHFILISDLTYGNYELKIRMFNPFGEFVGEKSFTISANTPFFYRTEFLMTVFILVIVFYVLFVYYFIRSVRIRAKTKARIAMDLHDESGTILTRLLLISKREKFENSDKVRLQAGLKEALYSFRTYIDSISREKHTMQDLTDDLREFVYLSCNNASIKVDFKAELDKNYTLNGELFRDIKLSVYEIVTNSIKHSLSDNMYFSVLAYHDKLNLFISDDGFCNISELELGKGNGIQNIKKRIQRNKGQVNYSIVDGTNGLTVEINLPLK